MIELDGGQHNFDEGILRDAERDRYLKTQGLQGLRFSDRDVFVNTGGPARRPSGRQRPRQG